MAFATRLIDEEVRAIADQVLRPEMMDLAFAGVDVRSGDDYDDTPALFVSARIGGNAPAPLDGARFAHLHEVLHEALLARGEERFPHFSLHRAGDQPPDDEFTASAL